MQMIKAIYKAAKKVDMSDNSKVDVSTLGKMVYILEVSTNGYAVITFPKNHEEVLLKVVPIGELTIIGELNTYFEPAPILTESKNKGLYMSAETAGKAKMNIMPSNNKPSERLWEKEYKLVEKDGKRYYESVKKSTTVKNSEID